MSESKTKRYVILAGEVAVGILADRYDMGQNGRGSITFFQGDDVVATFSNAHVSGFWIEDAEVNLKTP